MSDVVAASFLVADYDLAADYDGVGPGLGAFLVVAALAVATYFLIRSMNKQFKKINFEEKPPETRRKDAGKAPGNGTGQRRDERSNGDTPR